MGDFQDLDHIDGLSISVASANLYNNNRDDIVLFYFRNGAEYASVYTQSKVISENIKWNKSIKSKKVKALIVNARNANCLTGIKGYNSLKEIAEEASKLLIGKEPSEENIKNASNKAKEIASPISDMRGTIEHRKDLIEVLTRRTLSKAVERVGV